MTYGRQHGSTRPMAAGRSTTTPTDYSLLETVEAIERAATLLGRRWKLGILCLLTNGRYRYNAMMRALPGATPKMLTQQLRALEDEGLVMRYEFVGGGKHTEYALTQLGEQFIPVVQAFTEWVSRHRSRADGGLADRPGAELGASTSAGARIGVRAD